MRKRKLTRMIWHDDAATLKQLFLNEADPQVRLRLQLLWLVRRDGSIAATADRLGVPYSTAQRWLAWYKKHGIAALRQHKKGGGPGGRSLLNPAQTEELLTTIKQANFHTASAIQAEISQRYQVHYQRNGVYSLLRRLKLKKKVPRPHAEKADADLQLAWKKGV
jgi:molybdate transport repressor ModE-like protein